MYHQKLVCCVKVGGKVLRESGDSVNIPFGSEYSILLKNLNSVRIQAKVFIDGQDATEGTWSTIWDFTPAGQFRLRDLPGGRVPLTLATLAIMSRTRPA